MTTDSGGAHNGELAFHWTCRCCGKAHDSLPTCFGPDVPDAWIAIAESEKAPGSFVDTDLCAIHTPSRSEFLVRSLLDIPIMGYSAPLRWIVWVSLSNEHFAWAQSVRGKTDIGDSPDTGGWLNNQLPTYPDTSRLLGRLHFRNGGLRPLYVLNEDLDHPLAREQRDGVSVDRVAEIVMLIVNHGGAA